MAPKARLWVLAAGAWIALCWFALIGSALTGDIGGVVVAIVGMLPINVLWRFRYWRAKKTPHRDAMTTIERQPDPIDYYDRGHHYVEEREPEMVEVADTFRRGWGSMIAGFFYPMRDAVAEWRASRGRGAGAPV